MQSNVERKMPISVIIPVYNGEKYIERCLRSIQDQSMKSLEIIVVNDGSTDRSASIVAQMSKEDPRIILCEHPKNMGLFQARLTGVNASHGEYIAFVDADDAVSFDWFRLLYQKAVEEQNDITIGQFLCDFGMEHKTYFNLDPLRQSMSLVGKEVFDRFIGQEGSCYSWHLVWNKLYTRALWMSVIEDLEQFSKEHPHFIMCEDIAFSGTLWSHAQKVGNVTTGAYYYYNRANENQSTAGSFQRKKTLNNINNVINAFALMETQMKKQDFYEEYQKNFYAWKLYYARMYFNILKQDDTFNKKNDGRIIREAFQIEEQDDVTDYKDRYHYCYSSETTVNYDLLMKMEDAKKMICSEQKQVVSFDIFDTLILRPFWTPADMFRLMNDEFNKACNICSDANFFDIRVTAEQNCRARIHADCFGFEDITLDEIYDQIAMDYQFDKEALEQIKELEKKLEIRFCVQRNMGKQLFELAKFAGKRVIICSDMYLPKDVIKQILKKNGYQYDKLYLSSDLRVAKCTGNMFKYVAKKLALPAGSFVHIGDNWESDVISAHKQGWSSIFLAKAVDVFCNHIPGAYYGESYARIWGRVGQMQDTANGASAYFGTRCALAMVANKLCDNPFQTVSVQSDFNIDTYWVGYYALGMYLYSVTDWIADRAKQKGADCVHFVARDGYLPMLAYQIFKETDPTLPRDSYLYVSRKALALADVYSGKDLYSLTSKLNFTNLSPYKLEKMFVDLYKDGATSVQEELRINNAVFKTHFTNQTQFHKIIKLVGARLDAEKLAASKAELRDYFASLISQTDLIFDIGYNGRVESILSKLLGYPVNSLYLHGNSDYLNNRERVAGFTNEAFYQYKPAITGVIREHVFMKPAPSTLGYVKTEEGLAPAFEPYKSNPGNEIMTRILHNAALEFVRDMHTVFDGFIPFISYQKQDFAYPFEYYLHYAKEMDRKVFGCVIFEDDIGVGKNVSALSFWNQDIANFCLDQTATTHLDAFDRNVQDIKLRNAFMVYPRWKKALCYLILDRKHFWASLKLAFKRKL